MNPERLIEKTLRRAGRHMRALALGEGVLGLSLFVGWYILAEIIADHLQSLSQGTRIGLLALLAAASFVILVGAVAVPLLRSISSAYVAQRVESAFPVFKNSLVTYVQMKRARPDDGMLVLVANQAVRRFHWVNIDHALDSVRFVRLGYAFVAFVILLFVYSVASPKSLWVSFQRAIMPWEAIAPPTRTHISDVKPGDVRLPQGNDLPVVASVGGSTPDGATLRWSRDSQMWQGVPMDADPSDPRRWTGTLPHVDSALVYYVAAGDGVSPRYRVTLLMPPVIESVGIDLVYPAYTRLAPRHVDDGNIEVPEGTRASILVRANKTLDQVALKLPRDDSVSLKVDRNDASGAFTVTDSGPYSVVLTDTDGLSPTRPVQYDIVALSDREPRVTLEGPEDGATARIDDAVPFRFSAVDDYGVTKLVFHYETDPGNADVKTFILPDDKREAVRPVSLVPRLLGAQPGDVISYYVEAFDNHDGKPNSARTTTMKLQIERPTGRLLAAGDRNSGLSVPETASNLPGRVEDASGTPAGRDNAPSTSYKPSEEPGGTQVAEARAELLSMLDKDKDAWETIQRHLAEPPAPEESERDEPATSPPVAPLGDHQAAGAAEPQPGDAANAPKAATQPESSGEGQAERSDESGRSEQPAGGASSQGARQSGAQAQTPGGKPAEGAEGAEAPAQGGRTDDSSAQSDRTGRRGSTQGDRGETAPGESPAPNPHEPIMPENPPEPGQADNPPRTDERLGAKGRSDEFGSGEEPQEVPEETERQPGQMASPPRPSREDTGANDAQIEYTDTIAGSGAPGARPNTSSTQSLRSVPGGLDGSPEGQGQSDVGGSNRNAATSGGSGGGEPNRPAMSRDNETGGTASSTQSSTGEESSGGGRTGGGAEASQETSGSMAQSSPAGSQTPSASNSSQAAGGGGGGVNRAAPPEVGLGGEAPEPYKPPETAPGGVDTARIEAARKLVEGLNQQVRTDQVDPGLLVDLGWQPGQLRTFVRKYENALSGVEARDFEGEMAVGSDLEAGSVVKGRRSRLSIGRIDSAGREVEKDNAEALSSLPREAVLPQYQKIVDEYYRSLTGTKE